jgi:hypothetical protein
MFGGGGLAVSLLVDVLLTDTAGEPQDPGYQRAAVQFGEPVNAEAGRMVANDGDLSFGPWRADFPAPGLIVGLVVWDSAGVVRARARFKTPRGPQLAGDGIVIRAGTLLLGLRSEQVEVG